jgi:transcriptional regulator with XRE-family HTH domain
MAQQRERVLRKFGISLADMRHEAGLSQEALAHASGLHRTYIGDLERGARNPTVTTLLSLAKGLRCPASELLRRPFE